MKKYILCLTFLALNVFSLAAQSLSDALNKKDTVAAIKIIKSGYNLDSLDQFGSSALMSACRYSDDPFAANFLLNHGAKVDFPKSAKGRTPLIIACAYYGGISLCSALLNHGAAINAVTTNGETALMFAASNTKADLVKYLIEKGANPQLKNKQGLTALDYATKAVIDDTMKKMMTCCDPDKDKTIAILTAAINTKK
jgi:ankyrin repeat protein